MNGLLTDKCNVFYILTAEVDSITKLDQPRWHHTLSHIEGTPKAHIVGGLNHDGYIKVCLVFDILNLKFDVVGSLITARRNAGVVTTLKYLWVFAGRGDNGGFCTSIERLPLEAYG